MKYQDKFDKLYYTEVGDNSQSVEYSDNGLRYVKQENTNMPEYYVYDASGRLTAEAKLIYDNFRASAGGYVSCKTVYMGT